MLLRMKTIKTIFVTTVVSLLIVGCASTSFKPWQLSDVKEGMDKNQVVKILGEPDSIVNTNNAEYLYYSYREEMSPASGTLDTQDAIDRRADELSRTLTESKFEVVLVDGKMINYKELKN